MFNPLLTISGKRSSSRLRRKLQASGGGISSLSGLQELNAKYSTPLWEVLNTEVEVDGVALISIDSKGADIRVRQGVQVTNSLFLNSRMVYVYSTECSTA